MKHKNIIVLTFLVLFYQNVFAQAPLYTPKHFVVADDSVEFVRAGLEKDGFGRTYITAPISIWDVDDYNTTHITVSLQALICIEGGFKNGKPSGMLTSYIIDSADHSKRYKIWEQTYMNGKLNGEWKYYNLAGKNVKTDNFLNDSLHGKSVNYWIDGRTIMEEAEFFNGRGKMINKKFTSNGHLISEFTYINDVVNGMGRKYYPNGTAAEDAMFKNGELHGPNKYYYPSGQVWIEKEYKQGKLWKVVANYTEEGTKRNPGTLKNGNGTIIYYNEDGTIRETVNHVNGEVVK